MLQEIILRKNKESKSNIFDAGKSIDILNNGKITRMRVGLYFEKIYGMLKAKEVKDECGQKIF